MPVASKVQIRVGNVPVGGGAPVAVQSMTLTKTHDVPATTAQIAALASAGCEIVRVAVPKNEDAAALPRGAKAVAERLLAGAKPTHDNAYKLKLVERTLDAVLAEGKA